MAATAANNTLTATITSTDINGNTSWNRDIGSPVLNGTFGDGIIAATFPVGTTNPLAPGSQTVNNIYVKNNAAPGSGITVQVSLTITGAGGSQIVAILQPGGVFTSWNVAIVAASGITSIAFLVAGGSAQVEYFLGG